jgi:hypothetical protein
MTAFEEKLKQELYQFLRSTDEVDEHLPQCPDVEGKWEQIGASYLADGVREFNNYPVASLGWMMYIGMALAKYWDEDWEVYSKVEDLYAYMRDKRDYDHLDEYIREEVLMLKGEEYTALETLANDCASRTYNLLRHENIEPGTKEAFLAYVACLHQLYLMGAAVQLKRMGYHMTAIG